MFRISDLCHLCADEARHHRDEPVLLTQQLELADEIRAIGPVGRADVVNGEARHRANECVRCARGPPANHALLALVAPATHQVEAVLRSARERVTGPPENAGGRSPSRRSRRPWPRPTPLGALRSGRNCGAARRPAIGALRDQASGQLEAAIGAAIVHQNELERVSPAERVGRLHQAAEELRQRRRLVEQGRDDADQWRRHGLVPSTVQLMSWRWCRRMSMNP